MNATARKLILTALAVLATGSAAADDRSVFTGATLGPVAELSAEERARLRERWQRMPSEDRDAMRRQLREEWAEVPPEARQQRRQELLERLDRQEERQGRRDDRRESEAGYGQGYGTRRR